MPRETIATYETITFEMAGDRVALITLNRPERLNALNRTVFEELGDALERIEGDDEIRVYMLTGGPRKDGRPWFSAGADLKAYSEVGRTPEWLANSVMNRIDDMLKPSIAVIDGFCTTGALELILPFDFRVASETAMISDWHLKSTGAGIGAWGSAVRLTRLVGHSKAKEMLLTGMQVNGVEAKAIGLVNRVFPSEQLLDGALAFAAEMVAMRADGARLTLGFLENQAEMEKHSALRYAQNVPGLMSIDRSSDTFREVSAGRADPTKEGPLSKS